MLGPCVVGNSTARGFALRVGATQMDTACYRRNGVDRVSQPLFGRSNNISNNIYN